MHKKNGVVFYPSIAFIVLLSGCFPWDQEDTPINIVQQLPTENKKEDIASIKHTHSTHPPLYEEKTPIKVAPITSTQQSSTKTKKKSARRRRRSRKKEHKEITKQNITPDFYKSTSTITEPHLTIATPIMTSQADEPPIKSPPESIEKRDTNNEHTIEIRNDISINDLAVKHWTGTYTPTKLIITINNIPLTVIGNGAEPLGAIKKIPCTNNNLTVHYSYEFLNGIRKGSDTVLYTVNETTQTLPVRFSWDTPWHVELVDAQRK